MKVFIGGSRRVSRLSEDVRRRLENIVEKRLPVVVGDANGVDKAVQAHLLCKHYDLVEVFCAGDACRNNLGRWPVRMVVVSGRRRDFGFYAIKDRAMADEASYGLMIWDGQSLGTLMNVLRLVRQRKWVAVYTVPERRFIDLKSEADWDVFVSRCPAELRERIDRELAVEEQAKDRHPEDGPVEGIATVSNGVHDLRSDLDRIGQLSDTREGAARPIQQPRARRPLRPIQDQLPFPR